MTISTTSNEVVAQGNGLTTSFDFSFPVPLASELFVYYTDSTGAITLIPSSQYTVTGIGTANGGAVTYPLSGSPIATGTSLTIQRVVPYVQLTDLVNQSGYYPNVVENALDYLTMQTQQLAEQTALSLQVPFSATPMNLVYPTASARAGKLAGFDSVGNAVAYPISASVGAGNLTSEGPFVSGVNFTPNVTTSLTLSQAYGSTANVQVHFDGVYQGPDQYSLNGTQITFTSPIPAGVQKVYIVGGTTLSVNTPGNGSVGTVQLQDGAVTSPKIAAGAVGAAELANGAVGDGQLAWGNVLGRVCDSIAALGALNISTYARAVVTGYYAVGDGGGGEYYYSASTPAANANGGSLIAALGGVGCWVLRYRESISIKQFGAKVDGSTDDTTAVQACITFLTNNGGGKVIFPQGTTALSGVTISSGGITLEGVGWEEYTGYQGQHTPGQMGTHGSYVKQLSTSTSAITIQNGANHSTVRGIAFFQTQPPDAGGWAPTVYAPTINCMGNASQPGGAALLENLFCWNCYEFIRVGAVGAPASRVTMKHIWGMPIAFGIRIYFSSDVNRMTDIHFWQFDQNVPNIIAWIQANGIGFAITRSDDFYLSEAFVYGYGVGLQVLSSTDGSSQGFKLSDCGFDACNIGIQILVSAGAAWGQVANTYTQQIGGGSSGYGVFVNASVSCIVDFVNFTTGFAANSGVAATGGDLGFVNVSVNNWNQNGGTAPAFNCSTASIITVSGRVRTTGGNGGPLSAGAGTFNGTHAN